jgi:hypothetical protein
VEAPSKRIPQSFTSEDPGLALTQRTDPRDDVARRRVLVERARLVEVRRSSLANRRCSDNIDFGEKIPSSLSPAWCRPAQPCRPGASLFLPYPYDLVESTMLGIGRAR